MVWLRRVLTQGLAALLFIALLGGAYIISLNHTLGNASTVESSLRNSNAYDKIAIYAITRATQSTSTPTGSVSLNDPQVKAIAQSVFSKQLVQQNAEIFINSNYRWLDGETTTPSFTIDVTGARQSFATQVNKTVFDYLSKLPVCTPAQLQQLLATAIDPLTITCRPSAVIPKAEADRVSAQILSSDFLSQPVVTAETLKISGQPNQNKPYYVQFSHAPKAYQLTQKMPFVLGALALIAAAGIILISSTRRKGIRRVGLTFELAGLLLVATKYVSDTIFTKFQTQMFANSTDTTDVQKPLIDAGHQLEKQIVNTDFYLGIAFVVIGLILLVTYFRLRPGDKNDKPAVADATTKTPTAPTLPADSPNVPVAPTPVAPISKPGKIRLAAPAKGPTMDIARPKNQKPPGSTPAPGVTKPPKPIAPAQTPSKKIQPRPRGRLIQ